MKKNIYTLLLAFLAFTSCSQKYEDKTQVLLWFDATASFQRFSTQDSIDYYLDKAKEIGVTHCVVDVKPITGDLLYQSEIAPLLTKWNGYTRSNTFDYVQYFIDQAHHRGMEAHFSFNIFAEGHTYVQRGTAYTDTTIKKWQTVLYTPEGLFPIMDIAGKDNGMYEVMINPADTAAQNYELSILEEFARKYPKADGVILDRTRYKDIRGDFSATSRQDFEKYIGAKVQNFPQDIFTWEKTEEGTYSVKEGALYKKWLEYRAQVIFTFMKNAREAIKNTAPDMSFGDYTGAWYNTYHELGVNWAANTYDPSLKFPWATPEYKKYGYAQLLDLYTTGCYFPEITRCEASSPDVSKRYEAGMSTAVVMYYSVEGSAELAMEVVNGATPVYGGLLIDQYYDAPENLVRAGKMVREKTDGIMLFDISHIVNKGEKWWSYTKRAINE
ncbi:MAG: alpha amylase family protein [Flavobacteriales bacterium]|nr:alpha amylase family protein [Flavobacteriales bacterium]